MQVIYANVAIPLTQPKEDKNKEINASFNSENSYQYLPGENRNASYISRLECMQAAVDTHLQRLKVQNPSKKVVLITFNNEVHRHSPLNTLTLLLYSDTCACAPFPPFQVTIVGDGSGVGKVVTGDRLSEFDELFKVGSEVDIHALRTIEESLADVSQKVAQLQEYVSPSHTKSRAIPHVSSVVGYSSGMELQRWVRRCCWRWPSLRITSVRRL
jgi:hypothetical protein